MESYDSYKLMASAIAPTVERDRAEEAQSVRRVVRHIATFRSTPSVRLLDVIYGPQAKSVRAATAAMMLDRKATVRETQYGNLRTTLLTLVGAQGECIASQDRDFECRAQALLVGE